MSCAPFPASSAGRNDGAGSASSGHGLSGVFRQEAPVSTCRSHRARGPGSKGIRTRDVVKSAANGSFFRSPAARRMRPGAVSAAAETPSSEPRAEDDSHKVHGGAGAELLLELGAVV